MSREFYASEKVKKHYTIVGICSIIVAIVILFVIPLGKINNIQKVVFILLLIALPILYLTRNKRMILIIDKEKLYFNDGLLSKVQVPLDMIESVQYHPELKFRVKLFKKNKPITIMNVFTLDDQKEILNTLQSKRHRIKIEYLQKPEKIITRQLDTKKRKKK